MMNERAILQQLLGITDRWTLVNVDVETEFYELFRGEFALRLPPDIKVERPCIHIATLTFHGQPKSERG